MALLAQPVTNPAFIGGSLATFIFSMLCLGFTSMLAYGVGVGVALGVKRRLAWHRYKTKDDGWARLYAEGRYNVRETVPHVIGIVTAIGWVLLVFAVWVWNVLR